MTIADLVGGITIAEAAAVRLLINLKVVTFSVSVNYIIRSSRYDFEFSCISIEGRIPTQTCSLITNKQPLPQCQIDHNSSIDPNSSIEFPIPNYIAREPLSAESSSVDLSLDFGPMNSSRN